MAATSEIIPTIGVSLLAAFASGKICKKIRVPTVTGYILVGLFMGPSFFNSITVEMNHQLSIISEIALGLILFNIGGEFHKELLKKIAGQLVRSAFYLSLFIFTLTTTLCFGLTFFTDLSFGDRCFYSLFLGAIAMASAPPTTLLVVKEYDSEGPLTDHIIVYLALGTILAIVSAKVILLCFFPGTEVSANWAMRFVPLIWSIVGSLVIGTLLGLGLSYLEQHEKNHSEMLLAVLCTILLGMMLAKYLKLESLLISLFLGFSLVNISYSGAEIHNQVKRMGLSIYALFFILAGAHIDLNQLKDIGYFGIVYIVSRSLAIILSGKITARIMKDETATGKFLGMSLLSHAGAALGIIGQMPKESTSVTIAVTKSVIAAVMVFEIIGPLLLKTALIKSREVKVASLLSDASTGIHFTLWDFIKNFLENTGIKAKTQINETQNVGDLMTRKIYAIESGANFEAVVKYIDEHHFPIYPVVGEKNRYEGTVDFEELKNVMFDPFLSRFVIARDLIGVRSSLNSEASMDEAADLFKKTKLDALPVVENRTLVGILSYKDLLLAMKKR